MNNIHVTAEQLTEFKQKKLRMAYFAERLAAIIREANAEGIYITVPNLAQVQHNPNSDDGSINLYNEVHVIPEWPETQSHQHAAGCRTINLSVVLAK